jgi:hypothetical protein
MGRSDTMDRTCQAEDGELSSLDAGHSANTIELQAQDELRHSCYSAVRRVSCQLREGVLIIHGRVPSYYLKQIAQNLLLQHLEAHVAIDNRLEVFSLEHAAMGE